MKSLKNLSFLFAICLFTACGDATLSLNLLNVAVVNKNDRVSPGENLEVKISGQDTEKLDFIRIEIPALGVEELVENLNGSEKWKFTKTYLVEQSDLNGVFDIIVTVVDLNGDLDSEREEFTVR